VFEEGWEQHKKKLDVTVDVRPKLKPGVGGLTLTQEKQVGKETV